MGYIVVGVGEREIIEKKFIFLVWLFIYFILCVFM